MARRNQNSDEKRWHLDKRVPVALLFTIVLQSCTIVWWARGISSDVAAHASAIADLKGAARDSTSAFTRISVVETELKNLNATATRLEQAVERLGRPARR